MTWVFCMLFFLGKKRLYFFLCLCKNICLLSRFPSLFEKFITLRSTATCIKYVYIKLVYNTLDAYNVNIKSRGNII